ncbi:trypsin-like serine protease [Tessaracoccus defluvii]|uniref:trypsin-like serine protease n=1 Tax=Tessaracoccus defluvii TaxID=1285901 RepID=UPI0038730653
MSGSRSLRVALSKLCFAASPRSLERKKMKKFVVSVVAGVIAAGALGAAPAAALQSTTFAEETEEAKPVVSVRVDDSDPDDGVCTGTAIDPHWVITARHCVDAAAKPGGSVRIGQGDQQKVYQVDRHEIAPRGISPCCTPSRRWSWRNSPRWQMRCPPGM